MTSEIILLLAYLVNIGFITLMSRLGWKGMVCCAVTNMLLIVSFGSKMVEVFGVQTNIGVVFYSAVIFALSIIASRHKSKGTLNAVHATYLCFVLFFFMSRMSIGLPIVEGNERYSFLLGEIYETNIRIMTASFIAFYFGNMVNILLLNIENVCIGWRKIQANVLAQFVDSILFFPIAFGGIIPWNDLVMITATGFVVKSFLNIIDTPIFMWVMKRDFEDGHS